MIGTEAGEISDRMTPLSIGGALALNIPPRISGMFAHNGTPYSFLVDRYIKEQSGIRAVLETAGFKDLGRVADYGCCLGGWTWHLAHTCRAVIGIDTDQGFIEAARLIAAENGMTNVDYVCAPDLSSIAEASLDGLISIGTLQVLGDGLFWHRFFADASRVLKSDGILLVNFATPWLPIDHLVRLEPLWYLPSKGLYFAADRALGFAITFARAFLRREVLPGKRYYSVMKSTANRLARLYRFDVLDANSLKNAMKANPIPSSSSWLPLYSWMVCRKMS